jgi:hypothetical protein
MRTYIASAFSASLNATSSLILDGIAYLLDEDAKIKNGIDECTPTGRNY